jgi:hypothetical protein
MLVVLQTEGSVSYNLMEATVEITDQAKCNALHYGRITDRMICARNPSEVKGPCYVRGLQ